MPGIRPWWMFGLAADPSQGGLKFMAMRPIVKDFPSEAAYVLAQTIRAGFPATTRAKGAQAANDVISWACYETLGDPDGPPKVGAPIMAEPYMTDDQLIDWLEKGGHYKPDGSYDAEGEKLGAFPVPIKLILKLALRVLEILA